MKALIERCIEGAVVLALVWLLAGCSTLSGLGEDITWIGDLEPPRTNRALSAQQQN